jgi:hypothetical protein
MRPLLLLLLALATSSAYGASYTIDKRGINSTGLGLNGREGIIGQGGQLSGQVEGGVSASSVL